MFAKLLIANRGEIAVRIIKTCRRMGIATVVVCSDADADSLAVEMADEAVRIGPAPAADSYLRADRIIEAAQATGAEAIHPGFGFLSERAAFAETCADAGIVFIGPNPHAIRAMGDKIASKRLAAEAGVSTVPGHIGEIADAAEAERIAAAIGYPVMLKASAGGGGKGIRVIRGAGDLAEGLAAVRAEARGAFGDDRIFLEKFVVEPRHIEIQVLGDRHGNLVHLGERECSIQRRNQKVIEEAPSPLLDPEARAAMGAEAVALARAVGYDSAGTVEFVVAQDKAFYFLEMNTRLQVEHPVTELVTGLDLVEQMIRVAAGEPLGFTQDDVRLDGWAVEGRLYAEDPYRDFLPSIGRLVRYRAPAEGEASGSTVRNDTGVREGDRITVHYDPMIAKLSVHAPTREAALDGMGRALEDVLIQGVGHNTPFLAAVMDEPRFREGRLSTGYIAEMFPEAFRGSRPTPFQRDLMTAAAVWMHRLQAERARAGDRFAGSPRTDWVAIVAGEKRRVRIAAAAAALDIALPDEGRTLGLEAVDWRPGDPQFRGLLDGRAFTAEVAPAAEGFVIRHRAAAARVLVLTPLSAELHDRVPERKPRAASRHALSPMPGLVVALPVRAGDAVRAGDTLAVIEAMKMQNIVRADRDGVVKRVGPAVGDSVAADEVLVEFA